MEAARLLLVVPLRGTHRKQGILLVSGSMIKTREKWVRFWQVVDWLQAVFPPRFQSGLFRIHGYISIGRGTQIYVKDPRLDPSGAGPNRVLGKGNDQR